MAGSASSTSARSGCVRWLGLLALAALLTGGALLWRFAGTAELALGWLPERLSRHSVTEQFRISVTEIVSTRGEVLEVATLETDETLTRYDMRTLFNELVDLGTTVSEIRTPVVYRYHIRLTDPWELRQEGAEWIVQAPALRPSLPPAIRTERLEKKSEAGWLRFNASENLAELEKNLTPMLEKRAGNSTHLNLVRESARDSVAAFVRQWLLREQGGEIRAVQVRFPDDPPPAGPKAAPASKLP